MLAGVPVYHHQNGNILIDEKWTEQNDKKVLD